MRFNYKPARGFPGRLFDHKEIIVSRYKNYDITIQMISTQYKVGNQMAKAFLISELGEDNYYKISREMPAHFKRAEKINISSGELHRSMKDFSQIELENIKAKINSNLLHKSIPGTNSKFSVPSRRK